MKNTKYSFWTDIFPVIIASIALCFSGISLCQSNASSILSKKTAKPYLDIQLKKFSGNDGYYILKRTDNGIQLSFQLEMANTGAVPITDVSISKFVFFSRNKNIKQAVEGSIEKTVIYPGKSILFIESIFLERFDIPKEKAWELAQKEGFGFDIEFMVEPGRSGRATRNPTNAVGFPARAGLTQPTN